MRISLVPYLSAIFACSFANCSMACTLSEGQIKKSTIAQALTKLDVCKTFAPVIWEKEVLAAFANGTSICEEGTYRPSEGRIEVTTGNISELPMFDIWISAPSKFLSQKIGTWGFESQRYRLMFMLDFKCQNRLLLQDVESRLIRADWSIAVDERNPNWQLFADADSQFGLNQRFEEAIKVMLIGKLANTK